MVALIGMQFCEHLENMKSYASSEWFWGPYMQKQGEFFFWI